MSGVSCPLAPCMESYETQMRKGMTFCRVPAVYPAWAVSVFLAFFAFSRINNFCAFNIVFGSIPTRASRISRSPANLIPKIVIIFMNRNPGRSIKRMPRTDQRKCKYPASSTPRMKLEKTGRFAPRNKPEGDGRWNQKCWPCCGAHTWVWL